MTSGSKSAATVLPLPPPHPDRIAPNIANAAMRQYLAWETGLIAQLEADDRKLFRVSTGA